MVSDADIQAQAERIVREFRPQRIILFGSWARGGAGVDSDVELLVVMPFEGSRFRKAGWILGRVPPGTFTIDLVLRTPAEVRGRYERGDPFTREAVDRGNILYEAAA